MILAVFAICFVVAGIFIAAYLVGSRQAATPATPDTPPTTVDIPESPSTHTPTYQGQQTTVAGIFSIKVPDGWQASISESANFTAIMFARPEQLSTLTYTPGTPATITSVIAAWNGLTEHFFVRTPRTSSQSFNPSDHQEITSEPFTFDDGTTGTKYYVVKHAAEAQKWGGLLRDTEWQGRTYLYKKGDTQVEAHLALYPSSNVDIVFYESVIKSITVE